MRKLMAYLFGRSLRWTETNKRLEVAANHLMLMGLTSFRSEGSGGTGWAIFDPSTYQGWYAHDTDRNLRVHAGKYMQPSVYGDQCAWHDIPHNIFWRMYAEINRCHLDA